MPQRASEKQLTILRRKGRHLRPSIGSAKFSYPSGISLAQNEIALLCSVESSCMFFSNSNSATANFDVGIHAQPDRIEADTAEDDIDKIYSDPNLIYLRTYTMQNRTNASVVTDLNHDRSIFHFTPPIPVVRDVAFYFNIRNMTNNAPSDIFICLYYLKMIASSDLITKLLKFYGDTKDIYRFRQRSDEVNKPIPTP